MTPLVRARIDDLFAVGERDEAAARLERDCGPTVPLVADERTLERIRVACIKLSGGRLDDLRAAIAQANVDWRDVLVAAGFGHDPAAHARWKP